MSCGRKSLKAAAGAIRNSVSALGSKSAFFGAAGLAAAGSAALVLRRRSRFAAVSSETGPAAAPLPTLAGPDIIFPIRAENISAVSCARCGAGGAKKGNWYHIDGRSYCQDCAPGRAAQVGVGLSATPGMPDAKLPELAAYWPRRAITLTPITVTSGVVSQLAGYAVRVGGKKSGLSLMPEVQTDSQGQVRVDQERWFVNYDLANKPLAGPFSRKQAQQAASLLCNFDWNRPAEDFSAVEVSSVKAMLLDFRTAVRPQSPRR